jgi:hypothetical protein
VEGSWGWWRKTDCEWSRSLSYRACRWMFVGTRAQRERVERREQIAIRGTLRERQRYGSSKKKKIQDWPGLRRGEHNILLPAARRARHARHAQRGSCSLACRICVGVVSVCGSSITHPAREGYLIARPVLYPPCPSALSLTPPRSATHPTWLTMATTHAPCHGALPDEVASIRSSVGGKWKVSGLRSQVSVFHKRVQGASDSSYLPPGPIHDHPHRLTTDMHTLALAACLSFPARPLNPRICCVPTHACNGYSKQR